MQLKILLKPFLFLFSQFLICKSYRRLFSNITFSVYNEYSTNNPEDHDTTRLLSPLKPDDHLIQKLPGLDNDSITHYAGHLPIGDKGGQLFYWLIEAEDSLKASSLPILIWLNGGPGCSSMDGLWLELGPFRLSNDGKKVSINPYSWHKVANLLFIDQPVGTGLAFTTSPNGYAKSDNTVNEHFYFFLQEFFTLHKKYISKTPGKTTSNPLFIVGESHAGHYIPNMAAHILRKNKEVSDKVIINLQGISLGNPWIDPYNQYDVSDLAHGLGLISLGQKNKMKEQEKDCRFLLKQGKYNQNVCFSLLDRVVDAAGTGNSQVIDII